MSKALTRVEVAALCDCPVGDIPDVGAAVKLTLHRPPGPVGAAYEAARGPIDVIMGPAGSGKTTSSVFKLLLYSTTAVPPCRDGVIRVRGLVLRDNYRTLYRTTLRTWFEFVPPDFPGSTFTGGQDRPAQHVLKLEVMREGRRVPVEMTVDFFAVGDNAIEDLLKGAEYTWVYCNEADLLHSRVITFAFSRTGRYPSLDALGLPEDAHRPRMVTCDMNPPDEDHPLWKACVRGSFNTDLPVDEEGRVAADDRTVNFFPQPGGLDPGAENRRGKSRAEYEADARTLSEEDVRRFVHGQPGYAIDGKPVYAKDFNRRLHVAEAMLPVLPGVALNIGFDQGLTPGAVLFQVAPNSQVRLLAELAPGHGTGQARFLSMLIPLLMGRFRDLPQGVYGADPAGFFGADREAGELSWAETVGKGLGHQLVPAATNEPTLRIEAVKLQLGRMIDAQTPGLIVCPSCRGLIAGFSAHYKFRRVRSGASDRFEDRPHKNDPYATLHDALQYGLLGVFGKAGVINEAARAGRAGLISPASRGRDHANDFSVWG